MKVFTIQVHGYEQRYSPGPPDLYPPPHGLPFPDGRGGYGPPRPLPPGHPAHAFSLPDRGGPSLAFPSDRDALYHHEERSGRYTPERLRGGAPCHPPPEPFPPEPETFHSFPLLCGQDVKE